MSHDEPADRRASGRGSRYERDPRVAPVRIESYRGSRPTTVEARVARMASSSVQRYEDFFVPALTWAELHLRTERWVEDGRRRAR